MTDYRSGLKKARNTGSAHAGVHHWIAQRSSAVLIALLLVWFVCFVFQVASHGAVFGYVHNLFMQPWNAFFGIVFIATALYHGTIGIQVVFEDYIHCKIGRPLMIYGTRLLSLLLGGMAIFSILTIYFKG